MVFYIYIFLFLVEERIDSTWHHSLVGLGNKMLTLMDFCFITQYAEIILNKIENQHSVEPSQGERKCIRGSEYISFEILN